MSPYSCSDCLQGREFTYLETLISVPELECKITQYLQLWKASPVQPGCIQLPAWTPRYLAEPVPLFAEGLTTEYIVLSAIGKKIKRKGSMVTGRVTAEAHTKLAGTFNWEIPSECKT